MTEFKGNYPFHFFTNDLTTVIPKLIAPFFNNVMGGQAHTSVCCSESQAGFNWFKVHSTYPDMHMQDNLRFSHF